MPARRSTKRVRGASKPRVIPGSVFLNIPYDAGFENLLLAYIAAISAFGFTPRATLEIPFGQRRLDRILALIHEAQYSIHDLSRVQWVVCESRKMRRVACRVIVAGGIAAALAAEAPMRERDLG